MMRQTGPSRRRTTRLGCDSSDTPDLLVMRQTQLTTLQEILAGNRVARFQSADQLADAGIATSAAAIVDQLVA